MAKVSIIIPIYNIEKYMKKCLESVLGQTFQDIEVILVDDGSSDRSGKICDIYAQKDTRVKVLHKKNGGQSDARNVGIKHATGENVLFIDGDDYIDPDMVQVLYENLVTHQVDVSACGIYDAYQDKVVEQCEEREEFFCEQEEAFGYILVGKKIPGTLCNKLIRRELIEDLAFPVGKLYEDAFYTLDLMQKVKTMYVTTKPMYYYVHRANSSTTETYSKASLDFIEAYEATKKVVEEKFPSIIRQAEFKLFWAYFSVLDRMLLVDEYWKLPDYHRVKSYLKRHAIRIMQDEYFQKARKLGAFALLINVRLYRCMILLNNKKNKKLL